MIFVFQPSAQEPRHERITRSQHVEYFYFRAGKNCQVVKACRDLAVEDGTALLAEFQHDGGVRQRANMTQRGDRVGAAAGDVDFFLGAYNQVAIGPDRLQMRRHCVGVDVPRFAVAEPGQSPQNRTIVDVDDHLDPGGPGVFDGLGAGGKGLGRREMCPGYEQCFAGGNEVGGEVGHFDRHVSAVIAEKDQRKGVPVLDAQNHQPGEPVGVRHDMADIDATACKLLANEAAHVFIADSCQHGRLQPKACTAVRDIAGGPPEIFGEARRVFQSTADLVTVEVDRGPAQTNYVKGTMGHVCRCGRHIRPAPDFTGVEGVGIAKRARCRGLVFSAAVRNSLEYTFYTQKS